MKRVPPLVEFPGAFLLAASMLFGPSVLPARTASASAAALLPDGVSSSRSVRRRAPKRRGRRAAAAAPARGKTTTAASGGRMVGAEIAVEEIKEERLVSLLRREGGAQSRPLLVNFWATWCEPCRKEFPDLVRVDREFRPRGLEFITISLDDVSEIAAGVPGFLREMKANSIPAYLLNADDPEKAITAVDSNWRGELPATFLYDRDGRLVFKHMGRVNREELRTAVRAVISDE